MRQTFAIMLLGLGLLIPIEAAGQAYLAVSPNPATSGQTVTLTASVYPPSCYGTITFMDYGSQLGTAYLDGSGNPVTLQISTLSVGSNSLTASYDGEGECDPSTSSAVSEVVNPIGPNITSLSPAKGGQATQFTIYGTGFGSAQGTVTMNGVAATVVLWGGTSITAVVPNLAVGTFPVVVTANGTASNSSNFTVAPQINSLSLPQGPPQMGFTITGTNFGATQGASAVTINGVSAAVIPGGWSATSITVQVPSTTSGNVVVTVSSVPSNGVAFTVSGGFGCS